MRCRLVASNRASASSVVSAAITPTPATTYGSDSCSDGWNSRRYSATASSSACGAKCDANAYGRPSSAASFAPNSDEPRMYSGTFVPLPGTASTPGMRDCPRR